MKHIKEILFERQLGLFVRPQEKGSGEWATFNVVREDTRSVYRVRTPEMSEMQRYPNTVHINRHHHRHVVIHPLILKV